MYRVDVYLRVRRAVMVDGMSMREAARTFGLHRDTVRKMLAYSVPPGYRRQTPPRRPKLEPYTGVIDRVLDSYLDPPDGPFRSVSVGGLTACGVRPDGRVECWGREYKFGGVPPDLKFRSVSVSVAHACGITEDYRVVCWGRSYGP